MSRLIDPTYDDTVYLLQIYLRLCPANMSPAVARLPSAIHGDTADFVGTGTGGCVGIGVGVWVGVALGVRVTESADAWSGTMYTSPLYDENPSFLMSTV